MFEVSELVRAIEHHEKYVVVPGELRSLQPGATFDVKVYMACHELKKVLFVG
jgi:hypothetical protein